MKTDIFDHDINDDTCKDCGKDLFCGCLNCYSEQQKLLLDRIWNGIVRCNCAAVCRPCEEDIKIIAKFRGDDSIELYKTVQAMK